jgi:hypothetical protein
MQQIQVTMTSLNADITTLHAQVAKMRDTSEDELFSIYIIFALHKHSLTNSLQIALTDFARRSLLFIMLQTLHRVA